MARSLVTLTQAERERPWATRRYLRRLIAEKRIGYFKPGGTILLPGNSSNTRSNPALTDP